MTKETKIEKSLVEQILDEMFLAIERREEFDDETIERLKELVSRGGLNKPQQVTSAIKSSTGGTS